MEMPRLGTLAKGHGSFFRSRMPACTRCVMMYWKNCNLRLPNSIRIEVVECPSSLRAYCYLLLSSALLIPPSPLFAHRAGGRMVP